jgi:hypothetical protein
LDYPFGTAIRGAIIAACVDHLEFDGTEHYLRVTEKRNKKSRRILLGQARAVLAHIEAAGTAGTVLPVKRTSHSPWTVKKARKPEFSVASGLPL